MGEHTPLPWSTERVQFQRDFRVFQNVTAGDSFVACVSSDPPGNPGAIDANAAFIVRAVNSHYDLIEALEAFVAGDIDVSGTALIYDADVRALLESARRALARTKEAEANHG